MRVELDLAAGRVRLVGRLDGGTAHLLDDAIGALSRCDCPVWTIDAGGLTVDDRSGLDAVARAYRTVLRHRRGIALVGAPAGLHRALTRVSLEGQARGAQSDPPRAPADGSEPAR